ncbi:hypothetical protein Dsin_030300 [Dipteronia sinensis]|uniref:Reverse transcriptase zinc-binding domain-containing protein n=1 Tax=Dipteronia sinensis TaxID=43782 RepID=A0AAD9ZKT9_9ROSI|nr:hypothetical protein Dsin_030300 [Dipteronia sinensis]
MSLFQILLSLFKELGAMCSKFWWGSKDGKRKISWISWYNLCKPKSHGGLGFKELSAFNQSLWAKQAWMILNDPETLAARVLKAKYFRTSNFLSASTKVSCSHMWRSLIWGRDLLVKGLRWGVGDGNKIRVFKNQWIPRPISFKPITTDPRNDVKVADILDKDHHRWDIGKLNEVMLPIDKDVILTIPISWRICSDFLLWHYDKSGVYNVQSGYHVACAQKLEASASNSSISCNWWTTLWKLNLPPKVRIFVWRACLNVLPTMKMLRIKKVVVSSRSHNCGDVPESTSYGLFGCKEARKIWRLANFEKMLISVEHMSVMEVFMYVLSLSKKEALTHFCMLAWAIWENRNSFLNCDRSKQAELVVSGAKAMLAEFQNSRLVVHTGPSSLHPRSWPEWIAPPPDTLKLNTAAASRSSNKST